MIRVSRVVSVNTGASDMHQRKGQGKCCHEQPSQKEGGLSSES